MSHYYSWDGDPAYTVIGKNGKERSTNIKDARERKYVPSVTTITSQLGSNNLLTYKLNQLLDAVEDYTRDNRVIDFDEQFRSQMIMRSGDHARNAADNGAIIHNALEEYYISGKIIVQDRYREIVEKAIEFMESEFRGVKWVPEASFTSRRYLFGGKVDMHSPDSKIVLDFKTKGTTDRKKMKPYESHHMQTAAYLVGLDENNRFNSSVSFCNAERYNLFISTEEPGIIEMTQSTNFMRDWGMFHSLLEYWKLANNFVFKD